ncbi:MAG: hypothetical protein R3F39_12020 [Myxococcota bacterium]
MLTFEVTVPPDSAGGAQLRMTLDAEHWMDAWRLALGELGEPVPPAEQVTCRIGHDGAVEVIVVESGRRLFIRSTTLHGARDSAPGSPGLPAGIPPVESLAPERPRIRRISRAPQTTARPAAPERSVPVAAPLGGGADTSANEALGMLQRHVRCEEILLWTPAPDGHGWRLHSARGVDPRFVPGLLLRETDSITGALESGPGRRTFVGAGTTMRCSRGFGRKVVIAVKSAVWAPVRVHDETVALIVLLNARRSGGFTDPELSAVDELSQVLGARLERAGLAGFE